MLRLSTLWLKLKLKLERRKKKEFSAKSYFLNLMRQQPISLPGSIFSVARLQAVFMKNCYEVIIK